MFEFAKVVEHVLSRNRICLAGDPPAWWPDRAAFASRSQTVAGGAPAKILQPANWPQDADAGGWLQSLARADAVILPGALPAHVPSAVSAQWCPVSLESRPAATLLLRRGGCWPAFVLETHYQHGVQLRRVIDPDADAAPLIVTLMDYPDEAKYNLLCMVWLRRTAAFAPPQSRLLILTSRGLPTAVRNYAGRFANVEIQTVARRPLGEFDHYNLAVKLPALASIKEPFLFLDADMAVLAPLAWLWQRRQYKPWIGVDDQASQIGFSAPFAHLNSGMQLVAEPAFYDYNGIAACFEGHGRHFLVNGEDQSLLFDYFRTIGYDYHHPQINAGWNCCSRYARLQRQADGAWRAESTGLPECYPVHIVHYFNGACRPWYLNCPLYAEEQARFEREGVVLGGQNESPQVVPTGDTAVLRLCLLNAAPDYIRTPGCHPFYPLARRQVRLVSDPDEADIIFWALDPHDPRADYQKLTFRHNALFKKHEKRFMLFSPAPRPGIFYLNDAFTCTPFPVYDRDRNLLARVIAVPWLYDGVSPAIALDRVRIQAGRQAQKTCDLALHRIVEPLVQSGLRRADAVRCRVLDMDRQTPAAAVAHELAGLASAKYYLHYHTETKSPLLLYHALVLGVVPVIIDMPDLPFGATADWRSFALFPQPGRMLDELLADAAPNLAVMRQNAVDFAEEYVLPPRANEKLLDLFCVCRRDDFKQPALMEEQ